MTAHHNTGIYEIRNLVNGKRYIGSAVSFWNRWRIHAQSLRRGDHHSRALQRAWNRYGAFAFQFNKLLICSKDNLLMYEQACMDAHKPEYNCAPKAGSRIGMKASDETRAKLRASRRKDFSPMTGKSHTEETKAKISASKTGVKLGNYDSARIAKTAAAMRLGKNAMTEDEVRLVRKMNEEGRQHKEAAELLGRTYWAVADVVRRRTFKWVE